MNRRNTIGRLAQGVLGLDGFLHLAEVSSAYVEGAYFTLALTTLHSGVFFLGAYFVGHDLTHHRGD